MVNYRKYVTISIGLTAALMLYYLFLTGHSMQFITRWSALISYMALGIIDLPVSIDGVIISAQGFSVRIIRECTVVGPVLVMGMGIFSYPASLRRKAWGVVWGTLIMLLVNQIRIASLFFIGIKFPVLLEVAHLVIWQGILIAIGIVIWLIWVEKADSAA